MKFMQKYFKGIFAALLLGATAASASPVDTTAPSGATNFAAMFSLVSFGPNTNVQVVVSVPRNSDAETAPPNPDAPDKNPRTMWFRVHNGSTDTWRKINLLPLSNTWEQAGNIKANYYVYPSSWQKTFVGTFAGPFPESGTWEYYFGSGTGGLLRISPIMDPWRFQDFNDYLSFLHSGAEPSIDYRGDGTEHTGKVADWRMKNVYQGQRAPNLATLDDQEYLSSVMINNNTLLGKICASIHSPVYSYGVRSVSFHAWRSATSFDPELQLSYLSGDDALIDPEDPDYDMLEWTPLEVTEDGETFSVIHELPSTKRSRYKTRDVNLVGPVRLRWTRVGVANVATRFALVDDIRVDSLLPVVSHKFPDDLATRPAYPTSKNTFLQRVEVTNVSTNGITADLAPASVSDLTVFYRINNPDLNTQPGDGWVGVPMSPVENRSLQYSALFKPKSAALGAYTDFYFKEGANVIALLPGYYQYYFSGSIQGSFAINREVMAEKETVGDIVFKDLKEDGSLVPYVLDLRPVKTDYQIVNLVVPGATDADNPKRFAMSPAGDYQWRVLVPLFGDGNAVIPANNTRTVSFTMEGLGYYDGNSVSATTNSFGRLSTMEFTPPPQGALCAKGDDVEPIKVDVLQNTTYLMVEFNTKTLEYIVSFSAYQDFNTWVPLTEKFSDAEDVLDKAVRSTGFTLGTLDENNTIYTVWPTDSSSSQVDSFDISNTLPEYTFITNFNSSQWGVPTPSWSSGYYMADYLKTGKSRYFTYDRGMFLQGRNLAKNTSSPTFLYDGFLRLFGSGEVVRRGDDATQSLFGLGAVSVKAASASHYDSAHIISYSPALRSTGTGIVTTLRFLNAANVAKSGFTVSLVAGYRGIQNEFYEFRLTQRSRTTAQSAELKSVVTGTLYKWQGNVPAQVGSAVNVDKDLTRGLYTMHLVPIKTSTGPRLQARLFEEDKKYTLTTGNAIIVCDTPFSGELSGTVGMHTSGCGIQFNDIRLPKNADEGNASSLLVGQFEIPFATSYDWLGTIDRWNVAGASVAGEGPNITAVAPTVSFRLDVMPVAALKDGLTGTWETKSTWTVNSFNFVALTNSTIHCGSDAFVRLRVNSENVGLDLDEITLSSWRGNDDLKRPGAAPRSTEGFYSLGTWIERDTRAGASANDQVMRFEYSRRSDGDLQVLISPFLTNGLGGVTYDYRVLNKPAKFLLQYAYSENSVDPTRSTALNWITADEVVYNEVTSDFRTQSGFAVNIRATEEGKNSGYIRIAQVATGSPEINENACVLIDNFTVTDAPMMTANSWTASNAKLGRKPVDELYYGDRLTGGAFSAMMTLNTSLSGPDVELSNGYSQGTPAALTSPALSNGVGRVTFQARQVQGNPLGTKVRVQVTESFNPQSSAAPWEDYTVDGVVQSFLITNTVYTSYAMDVNDRAYHGIRLMTVVTNDSSVASEWWPYAGRVNFDQVVVTDPLTAGFRISDVTFSQLPSTDETGFGEQPLEGGPIYVKAALDRVLLNPTNIKLYFSYVYASPEVNAQQQLTWPIDKVETQWGTSKWLNFSTAAVSTSESGLQVYTMELTRRGSDYIWDSKTSIPGPLAGLKPSDIVQYTVWATYSDSQGNPVEKPVVFGSDSYKHPLWYTPRQLNTELAEKGGTFSSYFWIYSCPPGEVFFNELDIADDAWLTTGAGYAQFVELCSPAAISLQGWTLRQINSDYSPSIDVVITNSNLVSSYTTKEGLDLNRGFFLIGNGFKLLETEKLGHVLENTEQWTKAAPAGFKLFRDNGAYEQGITYTTYNTSTGIANAQRMAEQDEDREKVLNGEAWTCLVYAGVDTAGDYLSSGGIGTNGEWTVWANTEEEVAEGIIGATPGEINEGQVIPPYTGGLAYTVTSDITGLGTQNGMNVPSLTLRIRANPDNPNSATITYAASILHMVSLIRYQMETDGIPGDWQIVEVPEGAKTYELVIPGVTGNTLVEAHFALRPDAGLIFNEVLPYQATSEQIHQPWFANGMGFDARLATTDEYDYAISQTQMKCFVSYYQPTDPTDLTEWGTDKEWFVTTNDLELVAEWLDNGSYNICELTWDATERIFRNGAGIGGKTFTPEQPVEYSAWAIVTDVLTGESFVVKQAFSTFEIPAWYAGAPDLNTRDGVVPGTEVPYFYPYGVPADSVWINEVNIDDHGYAADAGYPRFIEIVYPEVSASNGEMYSLAGWTIEMTNSLQVISFMLDGFVSEKPNGVDPHFYVVTIPDGVAALDARGIASEGTMPDVTFGTEAWSFNLRRPNWGIAEGGVVVSGGSSIDASGLVDRSAYHPIWAGDVDAPNQVASVGLTGLTGSSTNQWAIFTGMYTTNQLNEVSGVSPGYANPGQIFPSTDYDKTVLTSNIGNVLGGTFFGGKQALQGSALAAVSPIEVSVTKPANATFVYEPATGYFVYRISVSYAGAGRTFRETFAQPPDGETGTNVTLNVVNYLRTRWNVSFPQGGLMDVCTVSVEFSNGPYDPKEWARNIWLYTPDQPVGPNVQPLAGEPVGVQVFAFPSLEDVNMYLTYETVTDVVERWDAEKEISEKWGIDKWLTAPDEFAPNTIKLESKGVTDDGLALFQMPDGVWIPPAAVSDAVKFGIWYELNGEKVVMSVANYESPDWYVPAITADLNTRPGPGGSHGVTPYYWVYATQPRSVWINEINYRWLQDGAYASALELAMINDDALATKSLSGWKLVNESYTITSTGELNPVVSSMTVPLTTAWGSTRAGDDARLAYYVFSNANVVSRTQLLPNTFVNPEPLYLFALRIYRDTGALEDEVYTFFSAGSEVISQRYLDAGQLAANTAMASMQALRSCMAGQSAGISASRQRQSLTDLTWTGWITASSSGGSGGGTLVSTWGARNINLDGETIQPYPQDDAASPSPLLGILSAVAESGLGAFSTTGVALNTPSVLGSAYTLNCEPAPWYTVGQVLLNGTPYTTTPSIIYSANAAAPTEEHAIVGVLAAPVTSFQVSFLPKEEVSKLAATGAVNLSNAAQMQWLQAFDLAAVLAAYEQDGISPQEKYWLNAAADQFTEVELLFETMTVPTAANGRELAQIGLRVNHESVAALQGDARLVLFGRKSLSDTVWVKIKDLDAIEASGMKAIALPADASGDGFRFFRCVLMSAEESDALSL